MSDGVVIPLDVDDTRAKGKVARLKRDAASAGREYGRAGAQAARVGGAAGGMMGRALGGFAQGGAAGAVGLGLTVAGAGLAGFLARDREGVAAATNRAVRQQTEAANFRAAQENRDQVSAGGLSFAQKIRRANTGGASNATLQAYTGMATEAGLTSSEGLDIFDAANKYQGVDPSDIARAMRTGVFGSADEAASSIKQYNGLNNAVAAAANMTPEQAGFTIERQENDPGMKSIGRAVSAMNKVEEKQIKDLLGGETARVMENTAADTLYPEKKLMLQAAQAANDSMERLRAAADSQGIIAGALAEAGRLIGMSEGSEARKLTNGAGAGGGN